MPAHPARVAPAGGFASRLGSLAHAPCSVPAPTTHDDSLLWATATVPPTTSPHLLPTTPDEIACRGEKARRVRKNTALCVASLALRLRTMSPAPMHVHSRTPRQALRKNRTKSKKIKICETRKKNFVLPFWLICHLHAHLASCVLQHTALSEPGTGKAQRPGANPPTSGMAYVERASVARSSLRCSGPKRNTYQ